MSKRINVPGNLGSTGDGLIDLLQASVFNCLICPCGFKLGFLVYLFLRGLRM